MKIKGFLQDVGGADRVTSLRRESINNASATPDPKDHIREISDRVHPGKKTYVVKEIRDASPSSKTYRLSPKDGIAPVFMAGQYMVIHRNIGQSVLTRAYSISSAPYEALSENGYIEFTVRKNRPYLVPDHLEKNLSVGDEIEVDLPFSDFFYQPLRDSKNVVALAGGSGITPFVSMAKEVAAGKLDINLTILYGSVKHNDIVCGDELSAAEKKADGKVKRWNGIAEAAAKQSKRTLIPEVCPVMSFKQALLEADGYDVKLMPYENAEGMAFTRRCIGEIPPGATVAVFIGPEGGLSEEEVEAASAAGYMPITLGRRILRTETAGMCVLSMLGYALEP